MRRIIKLFNRIFEYILQKKQLTKSRVGRHQDRFAMLRCRVSNRFSSQLSSLRNSSFHWLVQSVIALEIILSRTSVLL